MVYSIEELSKVEEVLESDEACNPISKLNSLIGDEDLPSVEDLIEAGIKSYKETRMFISKGVSNSSKNGRPDGYCIELEKPTGDGYSIESFYKVIDEKVSIRLIEKINELAMLGFVLEKSDATVKVDIGR